MKLRTFIIFTSFFLTISFVSFAQKVTNEELLRIFNLTTFRVPSYTQKLWTIEIISDTLLQRETVNIKKVLSSRKETALIAVKLNNDTTISFTLIQNRNSSSGGTLILKSNRYEITWNSYPEQLFGNTFVIGTIKYEQNEEKPIRTLTELVVIELIDELKI